MIEINNATIAIGKKTILKNISVNIKDKELTTIIGPNGSGKSTLIKTIAKLTKVIDGNIIINNKNINDYTIKDFSKIVAYLPQDTKGFKQTSVKELMICAKYQNKGLFESINSYDLEDIDKYLYRFKIKNLENRYIASLSGGEKQRVYLAFALCQNPKILLLDEPTTYLDIAYQSELLEIIDKLKHEIAIVMVLHDINQAIKYSDHIIVLKDGLFYDAGDKTIVSEELLKSVYNVNSKFIKEENVFIF